MLLFLFAALFGSATAQSTDCAVCVVALGLVQQLSGNYTSNPDVDCKALGFCSGACVFWSPWPANAAPFPTDGGVVDSRRELLASASAAGLTYDGALAFVRHAHARLPPRASFQDALSLLWRYLAQGAAVGNATHPCSDGLNVVCDFERPFSSHIPMVDWDSDNFAGDPLAGDFLNQHFRGRSWRGKDCNDSDASVHPGALEAGASDANCNGIHGVEPASGTPYEQLWCSGDYAPMGLAIVGDSAAAHFHIPPQYLNAPTFNVSGLLEMAANEADWPQCSWATGYRNESSACPRMGRLPAPPASFYQRWLDLNLCNHGDFQNIGVNGARTGSMAPPSGVINALARNKTADAPMLVIYALIGNDVCNGHPGSQDWTSVAEFQANVLASLDYLQATLPVGSHVAFLGLADGRVLYDTTHTRVHPIGMPYPAVYEFLSCNTCNPCWGWLNTNETWRNATSQRAADLTAVYDAIIATNSSRYTAFDVRAAGVCACACLQHGPIARSLFFFPPLLALAQMYHLQVDWQKFITDYEAAGGDGFDLIEPADGFHESQTGSMVLAAKLWDDLATNRPAWIPKRNPNNGNIAAMFGDQGGY